jgi:predicted GNAT family acetyltransferase
MKIGDPDRHVLRFGSDPGKDLRTGEITESNVQTARTFLEERAETSLFLLSNLVAHGPRLGEAMNSGNYRYIEERGEVASVFALTRRGTLLAETGGRDDLADAILSACAADPLPITAVIGEWTGAESLWRRLCADRRVQPVHASKEVLYRLDLPSAAPHEPGAVRRLVPSDFDGWEPLNTAYLKEMGLPAQLTLEQRRDAFVRQADEGHWWGRVEGAHLVAIAGLNARFESLGQVGSVFTVPERRRKGLGRAVMLALLNDAAHQLGLTRFILFTGEDDVAARRLYESIGFSHGGYFGLFFGS